jgi:transposase
LGEVDYAGHNSQRGDAHVWGLLDQSATVMLTRTYAECGLRVQRRRLKDKLGFDRAAVAVARKLAVIVHAMLVSGQRFDNSVGLAAANGQPDTLLLDLIRSATVRIQPGYPEMSLPGRGQDGSA